ncbi:RHS repeat domain-containing protein [Cellulomonas sp. S1-8]|uniref:RHS repeat domain-containing protein n=1 Tax=Cellulomonas sp. S1-8 TaxID=2904790 RepID=UPI0022440DC1|nr:fibronectin type III domain-containing protein [Cellulomonas sp. S1-8]UZN03101.1 fibronectin type III domain-containing protein [Cellulomonas sp. S1-8]
MRVHTKIASTTTVIALVAGGTLWSAVPASAATAPDLASAIFATPSVVTASSLSAPSAATTAVRTDPVAGFPSRAGGSYAVLSSGAAASLTAGPQSSGADTSYVTTSSRGGAYDVTTLEVTLDVPAGINCLLGVTFRFLTDESPNGTTFQFNDSFVAEVGASTWTVNPDRSITAPNNFAFDTSGRPISVKAGLFSVAGAAGEAAGTIFNGATPQLTAQVPLTGGEEQKLFFSIFDVGDSVVDSAVLIDNLRIGTVDDPATQCQKGATTNPTEIRVSATAPTQVDAFGTADDTYTIPATDGVDYAIEGTTVAAGEYPATGTVVVDATAKAGYELSGPTQFTLVFTDILEATATEPTWDDTWGTADDTYTIPSVTGVEYSVDGTPVAAGSYPATGTVTVEAAATTGYGLTGPSAFTHTFTDIRQVSATEPTWDDTYGTADDRYTVPAVTGVEYTVDGAVVDPGTYPATGTVTVDATATAGYVLTGPSQFTHTFTDIRQVSATEPTSVDAYGTADDTYTIPEVTGVEYAVDGAPVTAGDYPGAGTIVVTATATAGYELTGPAEFTFTFTDIRLATAVEPTWDDTYGTEDDTFTVPSVTGVQYAVDGTPVAPGEHPASGPVVVTATATTGYELTGPSEFTFTFTDIRLATAVEPTWDDTYGTADDTYTIPTVTGVQYAVDGTPVAPGEHPASGTVVVTASATTGYELTGASEFTRTFTDIRLVTAQAPTQDDPYGTAADTYTIPSVTGVEYRVDGDVVDAGTYPGTGTVVVTATATPGHELTGPSEFTLVFTDITLTEVVAPTWHDVDGTADDTFTLPAVDGVVWTRDGGVLAPGTHPGSGTVTLVATAAPGHELTGTTTHSFTFTDLEHVTPTAPTATDNPGTALDVVTIPAVTGVTYLHDGTALAPGDHALTGDVVITAVPAAPRYVLVGTTTFTLHLSDVDVPGAPTITAVTVGSRSLTVAFAAPTATGGIPVTGYAYSLDGGSTWVEADGSPVVVTGLVNGTEYRVAVRAHNAQGPGSATAVVTATPVPAPYEQRGVDGTLALPAPAPDQAEAWVDGARVPSTVTTDAGTRTVTAGSVRVTLTGLDASGRPAGADGRLVVTPDGSVTVTGSGFAPGELVDLWLFSTPVLLGTAHVGSDGTFAARFALPTGVPAGQHTLQLNGTAADGTLVSIASGVLVEAAPVAAPASPAPRSAALAVTGGSVAAGVVLATSLLAAGGLALAFAGRRRRDA